MAKYLLGMICVLALSGCETTSKQKQNWESGGTATSAPANASHLTAQEYDEILECVAINRKIVEEACGEAAAKTYSSKLSEEIFILDYEDAINRIINMRKHMIAFHSK